jgi:uncharacterized protein (DUF1778 family)
MAGAAPKRHDAKGTKQRGVTINIRATEQTRSLIDRAAALIGKTRTDFVLESARSRAEDVLLDHRLFGLDEKRYAAFIAVLDDPAPPTDQLKRLMGGRSSWEK